MIETIVNELESLKAKVQAAIDHAKAGVTHLNEDQAAELVRLVEVIDDESCRVYSAVHAALAGAEAKAETLIERVEGAVGGLVEKVEEKLGLKEAEPSAADLDAHADEQKAADATKAE